MSGRAVVGVDLGGTRLRAVVADGDGAVLSRRDVATDRDDLVGQLASVVDDLAGSAGVTVARTVIGGAGVPDGADGAFTRAPNLTGHGRVPLGRALSALTGHAVLLENDVNVAAVGELHAGVGLEADDFAVVSVGTGIGAGVVVGRRLVRGARGGAGEIGYLPLGADPLDPRHHVHGALEEVASGSGVERRYAAETGEAVDAVTVFERAEAGDDTARRVVEDAEQWIAAAVATLAAVLDPRVVVLVGGIGERRDVLDSVRRWLVRYGVRLDVQHSGVVGGAPLVGAVQLALEDLRAGADSRLNGQGGES